MGAVAEPDEEQEPTNAQVAKGCVSEGCGCGVPFLAGPDSGGRGHRDGGWLTKRRGRRPGRMQRVEDEWSVVRDALQVRQSWVVRTSPLVFGESGPDGGGL